MAIEDHPKFPEWANALDALKAAKDAYQTAVAFGEPVSVTENAKAALLVAHARYLQVSDEIDA